ncbi:MAG TPA: STAS domain-containing protein [Bacteroidales bacterium]|jgi:anti-sigma B factor antagonist|nr:STAS domain-containing protein [Bacteroidales bacterium]
MLKIEKINNITVVRFNNIDRFNALITEPVKEDLKSFYNTPGTRLILNLEGIKYIDSSGFGVFLSLLKTATNSKGIFKICGINDSVMELFKMLQLHNVFTLYKTLDECLDSF